MGTPDEVYRRPGNLFVAGFVGSPPINRIPLSRNERGHLAGGPFALHAPSGLDGATLGVRPEDLAVAAAGNGDPTEADDFRANVLRVEALGSEQRVHLDGPGEAGWVARASPARRVAPGDRVSVSVAWERSHLFGPHGRREEAAPRPIRQRGSR
ncbi:TOBE domain-containing protein [Candidatus Palauibacter sp.]|uniref:TOBE domain-containing protein n=1 Tax=Candidatus Palauibacter sp. TaxID=3101350 RepID=UPI003B012AC8